MPDEAWANGRRRALAAATRAREAAGTLEGWLWKNVVAHDALPRDLPEPIARILDALRVALAEIRQAAKTAIEPYSSGPSATFVGGRALGREEYHRIRAIGVGFSVVCKLTARGCLKNSLAPPGFIDCFFGLTKKSQRNLRAVTVESLANEIPILIAHDDY